MDNLDVSINSEDIEVTVGSDVANIVATANVQGAKGDKGDPGNDGFSPTASVTKTGSISTFSVTDKYGTTTTYIYDGQDGQDGQAGAPGADGADGFSPIATVSKTGDTATISITDKNGTTTSTITDGVDGANGNDGADGFSPIANVSKSGSTATITITDSIGTTTTTISDGVDGQDGADGNDGQDGYSPSASVSKVGDTATITITDKTGTTTATVSDGTTPTIDNTHLVNVGTTRDYDYGTNIIYGNNMLKLTSDEVNWRYGYIDNAGNFRPQEKSILFNLIPIEAGKYYTLSINGPIDEQTQQVVPPYQMRFIYYNANKSYLSKGTQTSYQTTLTEQAPTNASYMLVMINYDNASKINYSFMTTMNIMLNEGQTALTYEAYKYPYILGNSKKIVDTGDYWTKEDIILERNSNKVTSISSSSTDTQYPSAKCVYDAIYGAITSNY